MKPSSKYGSAYPASASTRKTTTAHAPKAPVGVATIDTPATSAAQLPHERDESIDRGGGGVDSESVEQAGRDVKRGLPDTDRGAEVHHTYQKQKR